MNNPPRPVVERCIEALIELLDSIDDDPELEPEAVESDGDDEDYSEACWL